MNFIHYSGNRDFWGIGTFGESEDSGKRDVQGMIVSLFPECLFSSRDSPKVPIPQMPGLGQVHFGFGHRKVTGQKFVGVFKPCGKMSVSDFIILEGKLRALLAMQHYILFISTLFKFSKSNIWV
uniref:Uncharacterized protein n=1 Tax=Romanomermis culicivorax TaxID=13658 RepID=A0A915HL04_ROMCU